LQRPNSELGFYRTAEKSRSRNETEALNYTFKTGADEREILSLQKLPYHLYPKTRWQSRGTFRRETERALGFQVRFRAENPALFKVSENQRKSMALITGSRVIGGNVID